MSSLSRLNWSRGFFRLWIVGACVWAPIGFGLSMDATEPRHDTPPELAPSLSERLLEAAAAAFLPSLGVLLAFLILRWVIRGFRPDPLMEAE